MYISTRQKYYHFFILQKIQYHFLALLLTSWSLSKAFDMFDTRVWLWSGLYMLRLSLSQLCRLVSAEVHQGSLPFAISNSSII